MKKYIYVMSVCLGLISCSKDDNPNSLATDFVVAFESPSNGFEPEETSKTIPLVFSVPATSSGNITIEITTQNAVYGEDFTTQPASVNNTLILPIISGNSQASFTLNKLQNPVEGEDALITFKITEVNHPGGYTQGYSTTQVSLGENISLGGQVAPQVGGPNQPNQVYIDLSSQKQTAIRRDQWDLAFYSGDSFRVAINGALYMAAAQLETTDINSVNQSQVAELMELVAVGTFDPSNMEYIDNPNGDIHLTAIDAISNNNNENRVYLLNMGYEIGTETPEPGTVAIAGEHRGWKKIRILKSDSDYILQYANLNDTSYQTATISKSPGFNFTFFSINTQNTVTVEPKQDKWDLNFTVFTNEIPGYGSYGYSDFVASNRKGGVTGYMVEGTINDYQAFTLTHVDSQLLDVDQRFIGSNWRIGGGPETPPQINENLFFVIKDTDQNVYKLRFTALLNENGVRGYPAFEYELLN